MKWWLYNIDKRNFMQTWKQIKPYEKLDDEQY